MIVFSSNTQKVIDWMQFEEKQVQSMFTLWRNFHIRIYNTTIIIVLLGQSYQVEWHILTIYVFLLEIDKSEFVEFEVGRITFIPEIFSLWKYFFKLQIQEDPLNDSVMKYFELVLVEITTRYIVYYTIVSERAQRWKQAINCNL